MNILDEFYIGIWILKKLKILSIFQNHEHVFDWSGQTKNAIEKNKSGLYSTYIELTKKHEVNPLWSVNFDRDSLKLHKVLQYNNWTNNQVKPECFCHPGGQRSILEIVKLANFWESDSECGSSFKGPLQESECYTNIGFHEILLDIIVL